MPLIIPKDLPAYEELQQENVFVMHQERAMSQHIRPLRILILNLMPTKIVTETQLARLLANSPLQVQVTFLQTATHSTTHTAPEHMKAFYKTFDEIKNERFDGMIITGAPIEDLDYEDVDYWDELCRIMDYTKENVYSTIHLRCSMPRTAAGPGWTAPPSMPAATCAFWPRATLPGRCCFPPSPGGRSLSLATPSTTSIRWTKSISAM